ncbi:Pseudouridine synthase [Elaphomyces granulatus]
MSGEKIYEGILAVNKPQGVTSAGVLRHLQKHFNSSELFKPWVDAEHARRKGFGNYQRRWKYKPVNVKIGHGGTLDPLATGVLVTGIGAGTKFLKDFLSCTKTYETILLFGAETDTYDRLGKVVRRAPYEHITRDAVEKALDQFRGEIMQRPPIWSALRIQGKKLYEYAREGKQPPVSIKTRPVTVEGLEILEWYEPGTHDYKWPEEEMVAQEKAVVEEMMDKIASLPVELADEVEIDEEQIGLEEDQVSSKRKSPPPVTPGSSDAEPKKQKINSQNTSTEVEPVSQPPEETVEREEQLAFSSSPQTSSDNHNSNSQRSPAPTYSPPPAVKISLTVSSGFYVRSFAHDLGKAVGSCGLMSSLVRSRQGEFDLHPDKTLEYEDLERGEEFWGPKVQRFLEGWERKKAHEKEA